MLEGRLKHFSPQRNHTGVSEELVNSSARPGVKIPTCLKDTIGDLPPQTEDFSQQSKLSSPDPMHHDRGNFPGSTAVHRYGVDLSLPNLKL